jgi:hypothetical protein
MLTVKWKEEYTGPGKADPNKTRDERAQELRSLAQTHSGMEVVEYYFLKYTGMLDSFKMPPAGLPMIETILNHEYGAKNQIDELD